ncbi:TPA: replication protein [Acinetobacter baumannii]|uniref:replication protein n=1 Tax=Acinetobacter baumannii TaxID=470 RepID=UPI0003DF487D|nr:replication protein [Acinetobacter baumannii]EKX0165995.1 replication protein [Acinetobacter baumannii]ELT5726963.1 replication protein [Acinetobacter baumannii]ETQ74639.1 bacteriophage replication protein O [Acinetobacter baumannii UH5107]EXE01292.1 bacteriophage replication O family protein [Acinetobacter baumannii 1096934]KRI74718.1 replication protein [Acinetobacter baumannii]
MGALRVLPLENVDIHPSTAKRIEQKAMSKKEDGYTPLPNFVCDEGYLAVLSGEAIKCLVLLNRQIKGFHEENKAIGESLILKLTGFKDKRTVRKAMSDLAKYNLVKITKTLGKVTSYEVTFEDRLSIELVASNDTGASKVVTSNVPRLVASNDTGTSSIKCHSVKEKKRNLKESEQQENPVDEVLNIWKPDLQQLNSWMQRSGLPKVSQDQVDQLLLEINPHYENKIHTGAVTSTQMYSNFVKWVKRDYKLVERLFQQASGIAQNINSSELKVDMGDW